MRTIETIALPIATIAKFDVAFSHICLRHRFSLPVANVSKGISHSGDGHLYLVIGLLAWLLDKQHGQWFLWVGLVAFAMELPIYWVLKNSVKRRRPKELSEHLPAFITPSDRYSLPSGHTAAGFVMASVIHHFYPELGAFAFLWASLIGLSRILLGVHFFTDIIVGAVLGSLCASFAIDIVGVSG
ncbi:phosphatase PAP2 family protein [Vibrio alfacsensis]|uniref:undecaprenyl-diphosphate phosphatase n=1 Tax=Vibrio alfacsensis TaxID=1074311 RepID=A0ABM6YWC2_9VIBR|nr:phosphatase PAP2 family protein [Vibrio alfacsensis]AXY01995.1 PAP2 family protein [Vibrio alfacsensis]WQE76545.1 phosphatase PAP2 family protein [Vibrio alfacsensis]BCN23132.1 phosphatase PAP2 family protein [Vibrio alfacsensis]